MREILEPLELKEVEKYTEEQYDDMLNDCYGEFMGYDAAYILRSVDPIAYRCGYADFQEYEDKYECPLCANIFDNYDDAKWCCQDEED